MTTIYFVRHCQSQKGWKKPDVNRPLTFQGTLDIRLVTQALHGVPLDCCICSPYCRSVNTVSGCAEDHGLFIHTDPRFGERIGGPGSTMETLRMRWANHDFHEEGGESLAMTQKRNMEGLREVLSAREGQRILFGTHGTALSTILNAYDPTFGYQDFMRLYSWMPYIIRATFDGQRLVSLEDVLIVNRGY